MDNWLAVVVGAVTGLAASSPAWAPWLLKLLSGRAETARKDRADLDARQDLFDRRQSDRIADLVQQVNSKDVMLLVEAKAGAAALAELNALKSGMAAQLTEIGHNVNGAKAALEEHVRTLLTQNAVLVEKVQNLESALAQALKDQQKPP